MEEDEDDLYGAGASNGGDTAQGGYQPPSVTANGYATIKPEEVDEDEEEGEAIEEDSDSDSVRITT